MMTNSLKALVRCHTTAEGGRLSDIRGTSHYGAPVFVDGQGFDCRIPLNGRVLPLGETLELELHFLNPKAAIPRLPSGAHFTLWEGKTIAEGTVI